MIQVKIYKLGAATIEVSLNEGANVLDALKAANIDQGKYGCSRNNTPVTAATILANGDALVLVPPIKGGS